MARKNKKFVPTLTLGELKAVLSYDPDTGLFIWLKGGRWNRLAGTVAGTRNKNWYTKIKLGAHFYHAHRLAWFYMTGVWPAVEIDHVNQNKHDNRWSNLREATSRQNKYNKGAQRNSGTGIRGVHYYKARNKWVPYFMDANGKLQRLGYFNTLDEATNVRKKAVQKYFGEFAAEEEKT